MHDYVPLMWLGLLSNLTKNSVALALNIA